LDAERAGAEINAVEIKREDLVLRVARLQIERECRFLCLALEGALGIEEKVLCKLLGQRRTALHDMSSRHVLDGCTSHADGIDTHMIAETPVLDRYEGVGHIMRHLLHGDHRTLRQAAARD